MKQISTTPIPAIKHRIIRTLLVLFCVTYLQAHAATLTANPKIIGGSDASKGTYPWVAALLDANKSDPRQAFFCGGSLIGSRWVLTAAHCIVDPGIGSASEIQVAVGIEVLNQIMPSDRVTVAAIYVHPDYDTISADNDIALLELASPVSNTTLSLANSTLMQSIATGDPMTIMGWGNMSTTGTINAEQLQEAEVFLFDFAACDAMYSAGFPSNVLTNNMICAGIPTTYIIDACKGDSGSPMVHDDGAGTWYQTGIVSFGGDCTTQLNAPGVYTNVANYTDWIDELTFIALTTKRDLGYRGIGRTATEVLTLSNHSGADIIIQSLGLTGSREFSIQSETCTTRIISNLDNCTITVNYLATIAGNQSASLTVNIDGVGSRTTQFTATALNPIDASPLDNSNLTWFSSGDEVWLSTPESGSAGGTAMRSGAIIDDQQSSILTYIIGPATLTFRWQASTEADYDFFYFIVDGDIQDTISGNVPWTQKSVSLGAGEHRIAWVYEKDDSFSELQDTVWLDSVYTITDSGGPAGGSGNGNRSSSGGGSGGGAMNPLLLLGLLLAPLVYKRRLNLKIRRNITQSITTQNHTDLAAKPMP